METEYRQIAPHRLPKKKFQAKLVKDSEYEIAVQNLGASHKRGEITWEAYKEQKSVLWNTYKDWAIGFGLYETVTPEQQLIEAEDRLDSQVAKVNEIRTELEKPLLGIKEVTEIKSM